MRRFLIISSAVIGILFLTLVMTNLGSQAIPINQPITLDSRPGNHVNLMVDTQGVVHVAYDADVSGVNQILYTNNRNGEFDIPLTIGLGTDPGLTVSDSGVTHIVWYEEVDAFSAKLWYASDAGTGNFTSSSLGTYEALDDVAIGVDQNNVHIAFNARAAGHFFGAIQYIYKSGNSFSSPEIISTGFSGGTDAVDLGVDQNGDVHIAFGGTVEFAGDDMVGYTTNVGGHFSTPKTSTSPGTFAVENISIDITSQGVAHISYNAYREVYYTYTTGAGLSTPTQISSSGTNPCLQVGDQDTVHLFFAGSSALVSEQGIMHTENSSGRFSAAERQYSVVHDETAYGQRWCHTHKNYTHLGLRDSLVQETQYILLDATLPRSVFDLSDAITNDGNARTDTQPQVAVDANNRAHIAYVSTYPKVGAPDNVSSDIMVTNNISATFTEPITVSVSGGFYSKQPAISVDANAVEHLVFMRAPGQFDASGTIYYAHNQSGAFEAPATIAGDSGNPRVVAYSDGKVAITYVNSDHLYFRDNRSGSFSTALDLGAVDSFGSYSLVLDQSENVHLVMLGSDNNLYYTHDMGGSFIPAVVISVANALTDFASVPSLAVDSQGQAHIVFRASGDDDLCYTHNSSGDFSVPACFNGLSSNSFSPSIAVDGLDHLHLVYLGKNNYGGNQIEYRDNRGGGFGDPELVTPYDPAGAARYFAVDSAYQGHIVCISPVNSAYADIYYFNGFVGDFYHITGYVRDNLGQGIEDANVSITDSTGYETLTLTDDTGYFNQGGKAGLFAPGTYTVTVSHPDYEFTQDQQVIDLSPNHGLLFSEVPEPSTSSFYLYLPIIVRDQ